MDKKIISVHTPKAAGTSFLQQVTKIYGKNNLFLDYAEDPTDLNSYINIDPQYYKLNPIHEIKHHKVVHGHFHPSKYQFVSNAFRMTFLRHPVDNIVSIFYFWKKHALGELNGPIFKYFKEMNLSITQFALIPKIRYLYSKSYFSNFDMSDFDFIGNYDKYDDELLRLGDILNVDFDLSIRENINEISLERNRLFNINYKKLCLILKDDIDFYDSYKGL